MTTSYLKTGAETTPETSLWNLWFSRRWSFSSGLLGSDIVWWCGRILHPEDGDVMILRIFGILPQNDTVSQLRRPRLESRNIVFTKHTSDFIQVQYPM